MMPESGSTLAPTSTHRSLTDPAQRIWDAFQVITAVGSPIALAAALLFYFGWSRSQAEAKRFGADVSVFDMSANELALRSLDAVFFPSLLVVLVGLAGLWLHRRLFTPPAPRPWLGRLRTWLGRLPLPPWMRAPRLVWIQRIAWTLKRSWIVLLPTALILLLGAKYFGRLTLPFWIGLAIFDRVYGTFLHRRAIGDSVRVRPAIMALTIALFIIILFWQTERLANLFGEVTAEDIKANPALKLHRATIYSTKRLQITAPGAREALLPGENESYRYQYDGLFLLQRSGGKYFFINDGWADQKGRLIVVPDNESVRLDFSQ